MCGLRAWNVHARLQRHLVYCLSCRLAFHLPQRAKLVDLHHVLCLHVLPVGRGNHLCAVPRRVVPTPHWRRCPGRLHPLLVRHLRGLRRREHLHGLLCGLILLCRRSQLPWCLPDVRQRHVPPSSRRTQLERVPRLFLSNVLQQHWCEPVQILRCRLARTRRWSAGLPTLPAGIVLGAQWLCRLCGLPAGTFSTAVDQFDALGCTACCTGLFSNDAGGSTGCQSCEPGSHSSVGGVD